MNLIFSFKVVNEVCKIMKESINEYDDTMRNYTKRTRFNCYYFHILIRYKIGQLSKRYQVNKHIDELYDSMEDELWMLSYYNVDVDDSSFYTKIRKKRHQFRNMDFSNGYRTMALPNLVNN